ncbi:MAG: hypothetical protein R3309_06290, partial [Reinekea sp.]|nr:hypothetical protein [Reinekea sp.]
MKPTSVKIAVLIALVQAMIAAVYWYVEVDWLIIALLVIPVALLFYLNPKIERRYQADIEASRFAKFEANRELNNVRQSVNKDPLTGLNSRIYIKERLDELLDVAIKRQQSC